MTDTLTVLECVEGKRCAKLYHDVSEKPDAYDGGFLFHVQSVPVADLAELAEALDGLRKDPRCMLVRDRLRADAQPRAGDLYARRRVDRPEDPAPFEGCEHQWCMFDADSTATAFDPRDPHGSVWRWRERLPLALRGAALVFQFSASQHLHLTVRGHAFFWLAEPVGNVPLARWSVRNGLDPAVFHAVQPLYTADPLFAEGLVDPLGERALICLGGSEAVDLDFTEQDLAEGAAPSQGGLRERALQLEEIADPAPAGEQARALLAQHLEPAFAVPGKRWDLCGHVGGACANLKIPPEECCAVLELLRAGDVPDHDFAAGLRWALGAYSFSAKPLGMKGIALLLGPVKATGVRAALGLLASATAVSEDPEAPAEPLAEWKSLGITFFKADEEPAALRYIWGPAKRKKTG